MKEEAVLAESKKPSADVSLPPDVLALSPFAKHCPDSALDLSYGSFFVCEITMKIDQACRFHCLGNKNSHLAHTSYRLAAPNLK